MATKKTKTTTKKPKNNSLVQGYLKALGDNASIVSDGTIYDNTSFIDTGCYLLNAQISSSIFKGIPTHKILTFAGESSTGKSFLLLGVIKKFLDEDPNSLVIFFESEGAIDREAIEERGIDSTRILFKPVESVEQFKNISTQFVKNYVKDKPEDRPNLLMCLDSLGMLPSEKEVRDAEEGNDKSDMTRPRIIKSLFRILTVKLASANIPLIVTNHVYDTMDKYGKPVMGGGSGLKYAGSTILFFGKCQYKEKIETDVVEEEPKVVDRSKKEKKPKVKKTEEHMGILVKSTTIKGRDTKINKTIGLVIHAEYGLNKYTGLFDFCLENKLITMTGTRYYWTTEGKENGGLAFKKHIVEAPSKFFTNERLDELDIFCGSYFGYGRATLELEDDDIDDEDFENKMKELKVGDKPLVTI